MGGDLTSMSETFPPGDPQGIWDIADGFDSMAGTLTSASSQFLMPWEIIPRRTATLTRTS